MYDGIAWLILAVALAGSALGGSDEVREFEWRSEAMGELSYVAMWAGLF